MLQQLSDFLGQPLVLGVMAVLFLALIGLLVYMRMKKKDDE